MSRKLGPYQTLNTILKETKKLRVERIEQLSSNSLLTYISEYIDCKASLPISIKAIFTKDQQGNWSYLMGKCFIGDDMPELEDIYLGYAFLTKTITDMCLFDFIASLEEGGIKLSENFPAIKKKKEHTNYWDEELIPGRATTYQFPVREFSRQLTESNDFSDNKLIGYKKDFYISAQEYVRQFLGMDIFHGGSDSRKGYITISTKDTRGRITVANGQTSFESKLKNCCLVGQIDNEQKIILTDGEQAEIISTASPDLELWLLSDQEQILDYYSNSDYRYKYSHVSEGDSSMLSIIERGEGNETEFKAYIEVTKNKNRKAEEIEKTVCAFSNAQGGYLIIGVSDDGCIEGVDEKVIYHYGEDLDSALNSYIKDIKKRLIEALSEPHCFDIKSSKIGLKHVIIITVVRTQKPNYHVNTRQAYIRRGATSAKMVSADTRESDRNNPQYSGSNF